LRRELLVVERVTRLDGRLRRGALPDQRRVDEGLPVYRRRKRCAKLAILEQRALRRIGMVEVEDEAHHVGLGGGQRVEAVSALLARVVEHGLVVRRCDVLVHHVDLPLHRLEQQDLGIRDHLIDDPVQIRELVPRIVHLPVIRIAHRDGTLGVLARRDGEHPRIQRRAFRGVQE
jgi:hypothetical protein